MELREQSVRQEGLSLEGSALKGPFIHPLLESELVLESHTGLSPRVESKLMQSSRSSSDTIYHEKTIIQKESRTTMFIAALFTIARTWKQPKCPSTDEWIKKMWHIYTMEYYSAIKGNKIELSVVRWMDLESVIQSEVSQKEKNKYRMLTHIYGI